MSATIVISACSSDVECAPIPPVRKRIVVLFGSPHKTGNTARMLSAFLSEKPEYDSLYFYYCYKENPSPCLDCGICKMGDACSQSDLEELVEEIKQADLLIIASPVYNLSFPSPLKAVLDRFQRFYQAKVFRKQILFPHPKEAVLLLNCGSKDSTGFDVILNQMKLILPLLNAKLVSTICVDHTDETPVHQNQLDFLQKEAQKVFRR